MMSYALEYNLEMHLFCDGQYTYTAIMALFKFEKGLEDCFIDVIDYKENLQAISVLEVINS